MRKQLVETTQPLRTEPLLFLHLYLCAEAKQQCYMNSNKENKSFIPAPTNLNKDLTAIIDKYSTPTNFIFVFDTNREPQLVPKNIKLNLSLLATVLHKDDFEIIDASADKRVHFYKSKQKLNLVKGVKPAYWEFREIFFKSKNWYIVQAVSLSKLYASDKAIYIRILVFHFLLLLLALLFAAIFIEKATKPLRLFTLYINHFLAKKFKLNRKDKRKIQLLAHKKDEVALLAKAFLRLDELKDEYIKELTLNTIAREHAKSELSIAKKIQLNLLPKKAGLLNHPDFSLYAYLEAAHKVGGDFYNFFFIDEKHLCFMLGDVSDKGIPAAIFMAAAKTLIETIASYLSSPAAILTDLNRRLCEHNEISMFTTVFLGILNIDTGHLRYVNAGNNSPVLLKDGEKPVFLQHKIQAVVGVFEHLKYVEDSMYLQPNDVLLMYTDGVTEARNKQGDMFSEERLLTFMQDIGVASTRILIRKLITDIKLFTKGEPQSDDIAVLALCYRKNITEEGYAWLKLPAETSSIREFLSFIFANIPQQEFEQARLDEVTLAIEEGLINVIKHAYAAEKNKEVIVGYKYNPKEQILSVQIKDYGMPFNPLTIKTDSQNAKEDHGFGFMLIEELSDELSYNYKDGQNIFDLNFILKK